MATIQHAPMQITCPQCKKEHVKRLTVKRSLFYCDRCSSTFEVVADINPVADDSINMDADTAPQRGQTRIWPWFAMLLIITTSSGFWVQKEAWLDNRWFRSTLINLGFVLDYREKDWFIIPKSIQAEWITRHDLSKALLIKGVVKNLLTSEISPPAITITFFSNSEPDKVLTRRTLPITLQPNNEQILTTPYLVPTADNMPIGPQGKREFVFLLESIPDSSGDFTLTASIR